MALKIGDIVRLKSGGPEMTVQALEGAVARCAWFDVNDQHHEARFALETLKTVRFSFPGSTVKPYDS
jgi:uncharacterized protein YodC (DUF2158 family)